MIEDGGDGSCVPTATLREILKDSRDISTTVRVKDTCERENIVLYLHAFRLDLEQLNEEYQYGIYALKAIQASTTYKGFADFFSDRDLECPIGVNSVDYHLGVKKASDLYRENQNSRPKVLLL